MCIYMCVCIRIYTKQGFKKFEMESRTVENRNHTERKKITQNGKSIYEHIQKSYRRV